MKPSEIAMASVIDALLAAGFIPDGQTKETTVRIPTRHAPVSNHGCSRGELANLGGRLRFALPTSNIKATVGPRTTYLYTHSRFDESANGTIAHLNTRDINQLKAILETI